MNSNDYYMFIPLHPCPVACLVRGTGNVDGSGTVELYTGCNQGGLKRMTDDTISRAAALDALGERPVVWSDNDDYTLGERNQYDMDRLAIETVPSAQPEIIHCKDCVHHIDGFFCRQANHHTSDKDHCASVFRAERRTDD